MDWFIYWYKWFGIVNACTSILCLYLGDFRIVSTVRLFAYTREIYVVQHRILSCHKRAPSTELESIRTTDSVFVRSHWDFKLSGQHGHSNKNSFMSSQKMVLLWNKLNEITSSVRLCDIRACIVHMCVCMCMCVHTCAHVFMEWWVEMKIAEYLKEPKHERMTMAWESMKEEKIISTNTKSLKNLLPHPFALSPSYKLMLLYTLWAYKLCSMIMGETSPTEFQI